MNPRPLCGIVFNFAPMEASEMTPEAWWKHQRPNYVYVAMAAGILCFLAFAAIWETFYGKSEQGMDGLTVIGGILFTMLKNLLIWVPFLVLEIYAFRFLPVLDKRLNPTGEADKRRMLMVGACVFVCFLPLMLPAILVWVHG
jgi:hypothetical protein